MKRQRNTTQMKEQIRKKHRSPNKWRGNRQTTWKRIQNNDSIDDQKPWKPGNQNYEQLNYKHWNWNYDQKKKKLPENKSPGQHGFTGEFYQMSEKR